jgi:hypothetical protein
VSGLATDSEGSDLMAGIWLSISPTLAGQATFAKSWLGDVGKTHKLPMVFIYGKDDTAGDALALAELKSIIPNFERGKPPADKELQFTGEKAIPGTKLKGQQLLQKSLETESWIVTNYIAPLRERHHRFKQWSKKDYDDSIYFWSPVVPPPAALGGLVEAKGKGEKAPRILPVGPSGIVK